MTILDLILSVKILGTGLFVGLPLLLLPGQRVTGILDVDATALPYLRLYGVAIIALLVGYSFGFSTITGPEFPLGIVCMGIVSNGAGFVTLVVTGAIRQNRAMAALIGLIAAMLLLCIIRPDIAMKPL